jgi:catechol 2,3-dioxygenase-like lactoylglutathione lyase family enzyme|tara:strand:- start:27 stop:407 length:381 start_codon:yes stop_codon:yes gene_type:complete
MQVEYLDHLVLTVRDLSATCTFYTCVLGMSELSFGEGRKALAFGAQKINLHQYGNEFEPKSKQPTPGSADLFLLRRNRCRAWPFICAPMISLWKNGPIERSGAQGPILSLYFRDPDANLIEVSNYL